MKDFFEDLHEQCSCPICDQIEMTEETLAEMETVAA